MSTVKPSRAERSTIPSIPHPNSIDLTMQQQSKIITVYLENGEGPKISKLNVVCQ